MSGEQQGSGGKLLSGAVMLTGLTMIAYHLLAVWFPVVDPILHQNIHLGFCMTILFLAALNSLSRPSRLWRLLLFLGLAAGLASVVFVHLNYDRLAMWAGFPEPVDVVVGIVMAVMIIFLTWREWGYIFPCLVLISIGYAFWGHHLSGIMAHPLLEPELILSNLGIGLEGTYGMMLSASANLIFLFIIFGSLFQVVGVDRFFIELGNYVGRFVPGGSAQTAIVSSAFVGMCTGSAPANVALTGSYTIPLMKKTGFKGRQAGAIEAAASSGGQLTPPIMGIAVFIMAGFLGTDYGSLMITAMIPAAFYYAVVMGGAVLIATKNGIPRLRMDIDVQMLWRNSLVFILPMGLLTLLLILHFTPGYASLMAILAILAVAMVQRQTRPSLKSLLAGLTKGAVSGAAIGVACATIGMFMKMLTLTGAASKLAVLGQLLAGNNLIVGLVYAMALSIILGCAMPIVVAYVICAIVVSPLLIDMGLPAMTAHFFLFYFAVLSAVTPPVAAAAMVGSRIAEANYTATGLEAFKLTLPFFLVPYFLVTNPSIMLQPDNSGLAGLALAALVIACGSLLAAIQGFLLTRISGPERLGFLLSAACATIYGLYSILPALAVAVLLSAILMVVQVKRKKRASEVGSGRKPA